ncbi:pathogenesis-related protein 1-like [Elaeis guineensis]|uniref:Pathogenesis-related protein 1-like n=1 Tax=Elaeis guineensis var. tenera TaxID=51953 RepID=A0A6I9QLF6_ELAGV|nr:pathogenesis-related protein 1-like [Elaeis guineensis]
MSPSTWTLEIDSPAPAARLFKAVLDWHNLAPKLLPNIVASAVGVQGDGSVGSVRQLNFTSAMPFGYVKERLDFVDFDKFECKQSLVEGGDLGKKIESASTQFKFEQTSKGGCVCKVVTTYKPLPGVENKDEVAKGKEAVTGIIKAAEAYLLANAGAYA